MDAHIADTRPRYAAWRPALDMAPNVASLMSLVREYLASWSSEALALLPTDLASTALPGREALFARAYTASRAELAMKPDDPRHPALREMALILGTAAARLRVLEAYESAGKAPPANLVMPSGSALRAEVRRKD